MHHRPVRVYADSGRHGYCRGCGSAVRWWDTPNGRTIPIDVQASPLRHDFAWRSERFIVEFPIEALHLITCPERAQFVKRRARSTPTQIALPVD